MKELIIILSLFLGSLFILISAIGLVRLKDTFSRMHAITKATSFGLLLLLLGVSLYFMSAIVWLKALFIFVFIYITAPLAAHSISKTIHKKSE